MAFSTISKAISGGLQRNIEAAELKHVDRIVELKQKLAITRDLRVKELAQKHTDATIEHATWFNALSEQQKQQYAASLALIEAATQPSA